MTDAPLSGLKVLEFSAGDLGPFCGLMFAQLGADVVKVEPVNGDPARAWGPPFIGEAEEAGTLFAAFNAGKRSVAVEIATSEGMEVAERLVKESDIVIDTSPISGEVQRPMTEPVIDRAADARLIYCVLYPEVCRASTRPATELTLQAQSGMMSVIGELTQGGTPVRLGPPVAGVICGLFLFLGSLSALFYRIATGRGQRVDVSALGSMLTVFSPLVAAGSGADDERYFAGMDRQSPVRPFTFSDGQVDFDFVRDYTLERWRSFFTVLGSEDLTDAMREVGLKSLDIRRDRYAELVQLLSPLRRFRVRDAVIALQASDSVYGIVRDYASVLTSDLANVNDMFSRVTRDGTSSLLVNCPWAFSRTPTSRQGAYPAPGEHTEEVLMSLGYTAEEVKRLRLKDVIR